MRNLDSARIVTATEYGRRDPTLAALALLDIERPDQTPYAARTMCATLTGVLTRAVLVGHTQAVRFVAFSPDGTRVLSISDDGSARVWRVDGSGEPIVLDVLGEGAGSVERAVFSADGLRVVTLSSDGAARTWNADGSGEPIRVADRLGNVADVAFSPSGDRIVAGNGSSGASVFAPDRSGETGRLEASYREGDPSPALAVRFGPSGDRIVTMA